MQGGALVSRRGLPLRIWYQQKDEPNNYGEYLDLIKGLVMPATHIPPIETRLHSYRIVCKKSEISEDSAQSVDFDFDLRGASAPSRSSVNNCTREPVTGADDIEHADHEVGETVNLDALSRQEKR